MINHFKFCFSDLHSGWNLGISCGEEGIKSASKVDILKTDLIFLQQKAEKAKIIKLRLFAELLDVDGLHTFHAKFCSGEFNVFFKTEKSVSAKFEVFRMFQGC